MTSTLNTTGHHVTSTTCYALDASKVFLQELRESDTMLTTDIFDPQPYICAPSLTCRTPSLTFGIPASHFVPPAVPLDPHLHVSTPQPQVCTSSLMFRPIAPRFDPPALRLGPQPYPLHEFSNPLNLLYPVLVSAQTRFLHRYSNDNISFIVICVVNITLYPPKPVSFTDTPTTTVLS